MRSLLGRFHRPMSRGLVNNMLTMNNLGDGSTLSLDFTTMGGVLDPRLTFSRASTATFVNSSGYVEYAAHNLYYNTNFATITTGTANPSLTGTGWGYALNSGTSFSATFNTNGSVTMAAVAGRIGLLRTSGFAGTGRRLIFSVDITSTGDTGIPPTQMIQEVTKTNDTYYINGTLWTSGNVVGPCTVSFVFTSNPAGNASTYFGIGLSSTSTGSATFANPRWGFYGGVNQLAYYQNTAATNANYLTAEYHAPRFDYSPTNIGEPRGLLIEGQTANLTTRSEDFAHAEWTKDNSGGSAPVVTTVSATTPANGATVNQIVFDKTGGVFSRVSRSSVGTTSSAYTMSVWMRTVSGSANVGLRIGADPAGFNCAVTTTWKRFQYTYTLSSTDSTAQIMLWDNIIGNDETATVYVWGCQVELGSGASSYIPTGASQVTRNADLCYMSDISSLSYSATNGSMVYEGSFSKINSASYPTRMGFLTAAGGDPAFEIFLNGTTIFSGLKSVSATNEISRTIATNTNYKLATSFNTASSSQVRCSLNGAAVVGSGTSALTATRTPTVFGFTRSGYDLYFPSGTIKTAKYWNTTLTDADLVSKST